MDSFLVKFRNRHPGLEYELWRENDIKGLYLRSRAIDEAEIYYHGTADILRYEILYKYG